MPATIKARCNLGTFTLHVHVCACIAVYDTMYMYMCIASYIHYNVNGACCHCSLEDPTVLMLRNMREEVVKEDVSSLVSRMYMHVQYVHVHVYTCSYVHVLLGCQGSGGGYFLCEGYSSSIQKR